MRKTRLWRSSRSSLKLAFLTVVLLAARTDGRNQFVDLGLSLDTEDPLFIGVPDSALGALYLLYGLRK
jgi:hypothetical protein